MSNIIVSAEQIDNTKSIKQIKTLDLRINEHEMDLAFINTIGNKFYQEILLTLDNNACRFLFQELDVGACMPFIAMVRMPFSNYEVVFDTKHIAFKNYDATIGYIEVGHDFYTELKNKLKLHGYSKPKLSVVKTDEGITIKTRSSKIDLSLEDISDLIESLSALKNKY